MGDFFFGFPPPPRVSTVRVAVPAAAPPGADRYIAEYNSLQKLEAEQKQLIDKLSYNTAA